MKKNMMIVAHPDDELLWGWPELKKSPKNWIVVVATSSFGYPGAISEKEERIAKIKKVSQIIGFESINLNFPDNPYNLSWSGEIKFDFIKKIKETIEKYNPKKIITHGKLGEYGHYHHRLLYKICVDLVPMENLSFFSFDLNSSLIFPKFWQDAFEVYFKNQLNDLTVIGHHELSKFATYSSKDNLQLDNKKLEKFYPKSFLNCNLNTLDL
jgi:LmbE family N-acetylglucosaminyl deacetylase